MNQKNGQTLERISSFLISENVTRTEIMWCLHTIKTHNSLRAAAKSIYLFPLMFPDSQIANKIKMQRKKFGYLLVHGLAPYFHNQLLSTVKNCTDIVIGFDESLNKISQRGQMDIFVRFWWQDTDQVSTRYFKSNFLEHATFADLLRAFTTALTELDLYFLFFRRKRHESKKEKSNELDLAKLLQISMDGPNVNFKFHRELSASLVTDPDDKLLLEIGSCGLHSLNGAFKAGLKATEWYIADFLKSLYYLLKNSSARKGDYTHYSSSKVFPQKFCTVRWIENQSATERAITIISQIKKYVEVMKQDKKKFHKVKVLKPWSLL